MRPRFRIRRHLPLSGKLAGRLHPARRRGAKQQRSARKIRPFRRCSITGCRRLQLAATFRFSDAIDFLRDVTGANILVNWKALEADSIDKTTTTVTVALHDVKFSKVLDIILQEAGGGKLAYTIDEGVITISTADELNKAVKTQVYDITDLLINPNFDPTIQNIGGGSAQVTGGGGGSGGSTLQVNSTAMQRPPIASSS